MGTATGLLKFAGIICDLEDLTGHKIDLVEEGTVKSFALDNVNRDRHLCFIPKKSLGLLHSRPKPKMNKIYRDD